MTSSQERSRPVKRCPSRLIAALRGTSASLIAVALTAGAPCLVVAREAPPADILPQPPPGLPRCTWTVLDLKARTLSVSGGCEDEPRVIFPVDASALGQLKKLRPGAWVFLTFSESNGKRVVVSIEVNKMPPPPPRVTDGSDVSGRTPAAEPVLYVRTDLPCTVSIDGKLKATLSAGGDAEIPMKPGQHVVTAVSEGGLKWEQIVEPKGPRTVVDIKLAALATTPPEEFDKVAARAWVALTDLKVAGTYAGKGTFGKSFGFHNPSLIAAVHSAHESLRRHAEKLGTLKPGDALRKQVADEVKGAGVDAEKYAGLITKAITAAQEKGTTQGEPTNLYGQAKALEGSLALGPEVIEGLRASSAFRDALPPDVRPRAGLPGDPQDLRLGVEYFQSAPAMLALVEKGSLAERLGFQDGDELASAAGKPLASVWEFKLVLRENAGRKIPVTFRRKSDVKNGSLSVPGQLPP